MELMVRVLLCLSIGAMLGMMVMPVGAYAQFENTSWWIFIAMVMIGIIIGILFCAISSLKSENEKMTKILEAMRDAILELEEKVNDKD